jgi:hypothetical protein
VFIITHCFWATLENFLRKKLAKKNNKTWFQNTSIRAWKTFQKPVYNWGLRGCGSVDYAFTIIQQLHLRKSLKKKKKKKHIKKKNNFDF